MSQLSPERRKVVVIGGSVAAMTAAASSIAPKHPFFVWIYVAFMLSALGYAATKLVKIKRANAHRRSGPER